MCAVDAAITAPQRGSIDCSADDVGAGAVEHRERLDALAEVLREDLLQARGVDVLAVGDLVAVVGGGDRGEHLGVDAGVVVGGEAAEVRVVEGGHGSNLLTVARVSRRPDVSAVAVDASSDAGSRRSRRAPATRAARGSQRLRAPRGSSRGR